jgi:palmitoyl-protein thioesterase
MLCFSTLLALVIPFVFAAPTSLFSTSSSSSAPLPLVIWHGLGDNYATDRISEVADLARSIHPGTFIYVIRLGDSPDDDRKATFWGNTTEQIAQICEDLSKTPELSQAPAIDALGFSQGGLFLRAYVERCNKPPVRSLVTFGSPHNGIADYRACDDGDWLCKGAMALLHTNTWAAWVQSRLVPAQYYRDINPDTGFASDNYLQYSNLLADINNERKVKNVTYQDNIASLEKLVMYKFDEDSTVVPPESEWFAEVNETTSEVYPLKDRKIYKEDWLGLKRLDMKGGLVFRIAPGPHMHITNELLEEVFKEFYGPAFKKSTTMTMGSQQFLDL